MKILSQRDPLWCNTKLGASNLTIGRYGCTTTSISMLSDYFHCYASPNQIAAHKDWYTPAGLVIWPKLLFPNMRFVQCVPGRNETLINDSLKDPNKAVIFKVNNGEHFVVGYSKKLFGGYNVADPWPGKIVDVDSVYHNIVASYHFVRQ